MAKQRIDEVLSRLKIENLENLVLVGVHFRGTDYAAILKWKEKKADISARFYQKAFNFFKEKFVDKQLLFLVVTDDPKLAKFILKGQILVFLHLLHLTNSLIPFNKCVQRKRKSTMSFSE